MVLRGQSARWVIFSGVFLFTLWHVNAAAAATYYVATNGNDASPGSQQQPFRTIQKGMSVMVAGDILYVRGGTYVEAINSRSQRIPTGTSWKDAPLISSYPGETVVITGQLNLTTANLQYIVFNGFVFDGGGVAILGQGPPVSGIHHVRLQNSEVMNSLVTGIQAGYGASYIEFINLRVHHNGSTRLDHGFYVAVQYMLIEGCDIFSNRGYGLQAYDSGGSLNNNAVIRNNRIHNNLGDGGTVLSYGTNINFYNNLVYDHPRGHGISVDYKGNNTKIYNNTLYNNALGIAVGANSTTSGVVIQNNIISGSTVAAIDDRGISTINSNNMTGDPAFVSVSDRDFRLQPSSAAIDVGAVISEVGGDFQGNPRPQGNGYDLGAYEYTNSTGPIAPQNLRIVLQ